MQPRLSSLIRATGHWASMWSDYIKRGGKLVHHHIASLLTAMMVHGCNPDNIYTYINCIISNKRSKR